MRAVPPVPNAIVASACVSSVESWSAMVTSGEYGTTAKVSFTAMVRGNGTVTTQDVFAVKVVTRRERPTLAPLRHQQVPSSRSFSGVSAAVTVVPAALAVEFVTVWSAVPSAAPPDIRAR